MTLFFMLICTSVYPQTFPCDGTLLFSINQDNSPTQIYDVFFGPFGAISYGQKNIFRDGNFDALGYNPIDSYIYGVERNTNEIVRLKSDGTSEIVGRMSSVDILQSGAGDCTPDGKYLCHDNELDQILVFDVVNQFALTDQIKLFWDPASEFSGSFTARIEDIAVDPNDPNTGYAFLGNEDDSDLEPVEARGFLLKINLDLSDANVGMVSPISKITENVVSQLGTLFFTGGGGLFGYGVDTRGFSSLQNRLVSINQFTGEARAFESSGPGGIVTDGCSCPYSISFDMIATPEDVLCTNSEVTYEMTITNRFFQEFTGITITDTLPEGMIIQSINGNYSGSIEQGTGIGTRYLTINGIELAAKGTVNISIKAQVNDIGIELISNQAHLENLPERLGSKMVSDDPGVPGFNEDPTNIFGNPQIIDEFEVSIINPTDCLSADDGQATFKSPILISGEQYQLSLRDENYDFTSYDVTIDDQNSFVIENMSPGEYELRQITAQSSNCSFRMEDTTINIVPPNETITAVAESNGPLCESANLELRGRMSPEGIIEWRGPLGYSSKEQNPTRLNVDTSQSGTYEMIANYGGCKQIVPLDIDIAPEVKASLTALDQYCERDTILLTAEGKGEPLSYLWKGPAEIKDTSEVILISSAALENGGDYAVIIDNGNCKDTASTFINVVTAPSISLPPEVLSSFCDDIKLKPRISGGDNVQYKWSPSEGLDCHDCPDPQLLFPLGSAYVLNVENTFGCRDSALVNVKLLRDDFIYIPNAFSPNADGKNDLFEFSAGCGLLGVNSIKIFNRIGTVVYENGPFDLTNFESFWDGTYGGEIVDNGVYIWDIELLLVDGSKIQMIGDVTVIR